MRYGVVSDIHVVSHLEPAVWAKVNRLLVRKAIAEYAHELVITPAAQEFMASRAAATITRVKAGHLSLISRPTAVTSVIEQAARSTQ